jgi:hypothetical protein
MTSLSATMWFHDRQNSPIRAMVVSWFSGNWNFGTGELAKKVVGEGERVMMERLDFALYGSKRTSLGLRLVFVKNFIPTRHDSFPPAAIRQSLYVQSTRSSYLGMC